MNVCFIVESGFRVFLYWGGYDSVIRIIFFINIEVFVLSINLFFFFLKESLVCSIVLV